MLDRTPDRKYLNMGNPEQEMSDFEKRLCLINQLVFDDFKQEDQYVRMLKPLGEFNIKILSSRQAAEAIVDGLATQATEAEVKRYKAEHDKEKAAINKEIDSQDLSKAISKTARG